MDTVSDISEPPDNDAADRQETARETAPAGFRDPFIRWAVPVALIPPGTFLLVSLSWYLHCPPDQVYTGYLQGDQPAYTAFARAVFGRGNGLCYANPFDFDPEAPRVLTNLGYVTLGWLFKATGGRTVLAWEIWRLSFGVACYVLFALVVARLFRSNGARWVVFLAGTFGAGAAWILTLPRFAALPALGVMHPFVQAESGYDFWCLNLFRQSVYPLELAYHVLFFAALLCYLDRRRLALLLIVFLLWWTHPVTAVLTTTVIGLALAGDWIGSRNRRDGLVLLGLIGVVLPWVAYYRVLLPRYPSVQSWIEQTMAFSSIMRMKLSYWPRAWGVLLLGLAAAALYPPLSRYLLKERAGRLVAFWGLAALAWSNNDLILPRPIQPMHFARGYIFLFLLIVTAKAVELALSKAPPETRARRIVAGLALVCLPLLAVDNVLFVARMATERPREGLLTLRREAKGVIDHFREQPESLGVICINPVLGIHLVAHTPHRVFVSEKAITPFHRQRLDAQLAFLGRGDPEVARQWGVDRVILVHREGVPYPRWALDPTRFRVVFDNGLYRVGEILQPSGGESRAANR